MLHFLPSRFIMQRALLLLAVSGSLLVSASSCSDDDDNDNSPTPPEAVAFTQANLYPEGVQYDAKNNRYLVSSQTSGTVGQVRDDGTYSAFAENTALVSSIGMNLDDSRNRLLVAVSDPGYNSQRTSAATQRKLARLAIFNRDNGQLLSTVDLGGLRPALNHFANDIAVDAQGNAYVTDSFSPIIYKVDAQGTATVFLENTQLAAPASMFGLNGIVFHPDGYLLVAKSDEGALFKVPISNPAGFTKVTVSQDLKGADGMLLQDNNTLQVVTNAQAKVYRLTTTNAWGAATVSGTFTTPPQYPTTLARREGSDSYVLYSNLNALQANQTPPVSVFTIARVRF
ncbi:gluconolaconase [Hymenobacter taeanensis]|uniref:Gluconolaconase n=1 Tax=Hymenobacter taeanensis TaxID=2735321 RepID=A0A6M6BAW9_9BACT|nr:MULTISPECIES: SMP-30/gluconolactonase/LRE family protein [Hymenobacter]QJX45471.1 gluconolaconase [Hymenobacter taeanensis]UOQ81283.1 SMP-30/gluconolactonase/LRE family protein [Hymenobacter sp. 5414T-23]